MAPRSLRSLQTAMCPQLLAQFPFPFFKLRHTIWLGELVSTLLYLLRILWAAQLRRLQATEPLSPLIQSPQVHWPTIQPSRAPQ